MTDGVVLHIIYDGWGGVSYNTDDGWGGASYNIGMTDGVVLHIL